MGYIVTINGTPVTWATRKQKMVTLSSTEAEYVGFTMCAKTIAWIQNILVFMGSDLIEFPTKMYCDTYRLFKLLKDQWLLVAQNTLTSECIGSAK